MNIGRYGETGTMDGECTSFHRPGQKTKANFYNRSQARWVCYSCAVEQNRRIVQMGFDPKVSGCISGDNYLIELLKG